MVLGLARSGVSAVNMRIDSPMIVAFDEEAAHNVLNADDGTWPSQAKKQKKIETAPGNGMMASER